MSDVLLPDVCELIDPRLPLPPQITNSEGTYLWASPDGAEALYVGSAAFIRSRIHMHRGRRSRLASLFVEHGALSLSIWYLPDPKRWMIERRLWEELRPILCLVPPHRKSRHRAHRQWGGRIAVPPPPHTSRKALCAVRGCTKPRERQARGSYRLCAMHRKRKGREKAVTT